MRFSVISDYILNKELFFPITDTYTRISDNEVILNSTRIKEKGKKTKTNIII